MAALQPVILMIDHAVWSLARISPQGVEISPPVRWEGSPLTDETERIVAVLQEWNGLGAPLLVGLSATLCVGMLLKLPTARHARNRESLGYLLEPYLPWAAEEMVADYEIQGKEAFAVGTSTELFASLLQQLEERGVRVESIAPWGRLALAHYLRHANHTTDRRAILWGNGSVADLWIIENKHPRLWRQLPLEEQELLREFRQLALEQCSPLPLELVGIPPELKSKLETLPDFVIHSSATDFTGSIQESAVHEAVAILGGRADSPIELRRDGLAPESRNRALQGAVRGVQAALLCLLIACGVTLYRLGETFDRQRLEAGDRQREIFQRLFPDLPAPVGVKGRLESEYAQLRGQRGEDLDVPDQIPATRLIERLLRSLPSELRYRILEIRVEQGRLYLVGQVRTHADADRIADELRKVQLTVEPPSTHRLPQEGVEFRISAQWATKVAETRGGNS